MLFSCCCGSPQPSSCRMRRVRRWTFTSPGSARPRTGSSLPRSCLCPDQHWPLGCEWHVRCHFTTFALSGFVRAQVIVQDVMPTCNFLLQFHVIEFKLLAPDTGDADSSLDRPWQKKKAEIKQ
ncbi:hypothetical protein ZEAMMB73_Zm00001d004641 [Zea mays]|uniref:Uncharacterized protein n=1 Tax=Zea mays TaxID=4577 RepID=A0A1D6EGM0_MAIZE|nr:hypothetical protein ZEAMMB73_Zm00001d004641 [Zea mays]